MGRAVKPRSIPGSGVFVVPHLAKGNHFMSRIAISTLVTATSLISAAAMAQNAAPALAKHAASFKGNQGLTVVVAPTADDKAALVQLKGLNHPVDGVVFLADKINQGKRVSLRATLDGRQWNMVVSEDLDTWGGTYNRIQAYLPAQRDGVPLRYEDKASKALDLKSLAKTYEKQKTDGVQDKLARFDKDKFVSGTEARLKSVDERASKACGVPVKTQVNWGSVNEDRMTRLSIGGYCATVADAMGHLCQSDATFKGNASKHAAITCQFGDKLNLSNAGGKTVFTTAEGAANQDDFALQYLRNQ